MPFIETQLSFDFMATPSYLPSNSPPTSLPSPAPANSHVQCAMPALGAPSSRLVDRVKKTHRVIIYCAGSRGLQQFLRPLEVHAFKIGVTGAESAQTRVEDLRRKSYAERWGRPGSDPASHFLIDQANEWFLWSWKPEHLRGLALPAGFHLYRGCLEVEFPFSVTVQEVDDAVHQVLKDRSLIDYFLSDEGKSRLSGLGLDPEATLLTRYTLMEVKDRISVVNEIYRFKPRVELPLFVSLLEQAFQPLRGRDPALFQAIATKDQTHER